MTTTLSSAGIWSVWSGKSDQAAAWFFAAAVPVAYWAPFFLAPLVPVPQSMIRRTRYNAWQACR